MMKRFDNLLRLIEKITNDDNQSPLWNSFRYLIKNFANSGFLSRLSSMKFFTNPSNLTRPILSAH